MKFNKILYIIGLFGLLGLFSLGASAQVTIGTPIAPAEGALLDLKTEDDGSSKRGLGLPVVELKSNNHLEPMFKLNTTKDDYEGASKVSEDKRHIGLMVYNTQEIDGADVEDENVLCKGLHIWDGEKWEPLAPYPSIAPTPKPEGKTLGRIGTLMDVRVSSMDGFVERNAYNIAQFGGVVEIIKEPRLKSCKEEDLDPGEYMIYDAGIWMTQNLATRLYPDGTPILYEESTAPGTESYGYPAPSGSAEYPQYRWEKERGLLYTWIAATHRQNLSTDQQGWTDDEKNDNPFDLTTHPYEDSEVEGSLGTAKIQGVCPNGWHLPSDRELSQLVYVIRQFPESYGEKGNESTNMPTIPSPPLVGTDKIGTVLKSALTLSDHPRGSAKGISKSSYQGGFNALLSGNAGDGNVNGWGLFAYFWSSSAQGSSSAWPRLLLYSAGLFDRSIASRGDMYSVRCKKD